MTEPAPKRHRFQFSIVLILLLTALVAVLVASFNAVSETLRLNRESQGWHEDDEYIS
jgi:hypothetical protein